MSRCFKICLCVQFNNSVIQRGQGDVFAGFLDDGVGALLVGDPADGDLAALNALGQYLLALVAIGDVLADGDILWLNGGELIDL